jgi:hypothetical protein
MAISTKIPNKEDYLMPSEKQEMSSVTQNF